MTASWFATRHTSLPTETKLLALAATVIAVSDQEKILEDVSNQFNAGFFYEIVKDKPEVSAVTSGFSVLSPLAQLALSSVGETHDETLKIIGFSNDTVVKEVFADVNKRLRSIKDVELKLANRVYVNYNAKLNDQFAALSRDVFDSEVKNVDFVKADETAKEINAWVENSTNNRIKDLVSPDSLGPSTAVVLVNAIYFKGKWAKPFDKEATAEGDFYVKKDKTIKLPMMHQSMDAKYGESKELDSKLIELPYQGDHTSFLIVLPNEVDGIASLTEKLRVPTALSNAVQDMQIYTVDVTTPKFKIETTTDLKDILIKMGLKRLFTPNQANLNNLLSGHNDLYVSNAVQKAFIEVNEEGAEAAAANEFSIVEYSLIIRERRVFTANHPFVFILKEKNNILFSGIYRS